ncbi:hypothetical protein KM043_003300 [Ampulex compressa]|nr:hypothetical protein KM043_003300 [Ampulex compressa]
MYELQDRLAKLRIEHPLLHAGSSNRGYHNSVFLMTYAEENENDNNGNEYRLPPPYPFRYESPICSRSLSITDITYGSSNNEEVVVGDYGKNDYDDVEDESPRKGLLKQMFCLPLN